MKSQATNYLSIMSGLVCGVAYSLSVFSSDSQMVTVDLSRCRIGQTSFVTALKRDQRGRFTRLADELALASLSGVHFGMCGADRQHGQAMLVKLEQPARQAEQLKIIPHLFYGMPKEAIEALFGPPGILPGAQAYKAVVLSGNRPGNLGQWYTICPEFTVQFSFDDHLGLTRFVVLPMDVRELDAAAAN